MLDSWKRLAALAVVLLAATGRDAQAGYSFAMEFNQDGVLPSSDPEVGLVNTSGLAESQLFSVSGGLLHQTTLDIYGAAQYWNPKDLSFNGPLSAADDFSMEVRMQILQINNPSIAAAGFQAGDGLYRYLLNVTADGVEMGTSTSPVRVAVDVFTMHTYRLESPGGSNEVRLYIDGVLKASGVAESVHAWNFISWGDGFSTTGNGANADYDYVRVNTSAVPEPSALALLAVGATGLALLRRGRSRRPAVRV